MEGIIPTALRGRTILANSRVMEITKNPIKRISGDWV
jgi:hypothetical protein